MTPKRYRKLPVEIDALRFVGNFDECEKFVGGDADLRAGEMIIATREGAMHVSYGDFIIKGVNGEFYPCKPDIFAKTYEAVES